MKYPGMSSDEDRVPLKHNSEFENINKSDVTNYSSNDKQTKQQQKNENKKKKHILFSFTNLVFLYFVISGLSCVGCLVFYFMDHDTAFIISGGIGITTCIYGMRHFYTLMGLKGEIDKFQQLNIKFKSEHNKIKHDIARLSSCNSELKNTHNRLAKANEKNREILTQFRNVEDNMSRYSAQTLDDVKNIMDQSKILKVKWKEEIFKHERSLLHRVFDRFCSDSLHIGMTKSEFAQFSAMLPESYQRRFERLGTFDKLSDHKDHILLDDFSRCLDLFAEMQCDNIDIQFEFKRSKKKRKRRPSRVGMKGTLHTGLSSILQFIEEDKKLNFDDDDDDKENDEDERDYDEELLLYDREIVITVRSDLKNMKNLKMLKSLNPEKMQFSFSQSTSADTSTPPPPMMERRLHPFGTTGVIKRAKPNLDSKIKTIDEDDLDMDEIKQNDFSNDQINKYMYKMEHESDR